MSNDDLKPQPDIEPIFVAQTSEPEHLADPAAWFRGMLEQAKAEGAVLARCSRHDDPPALLFEGWAERPDEQGEQRWSWAASRSST